MFVVDTLARNILMTTGIHSQWREGRRGGNLICQEEGEEERHEEELVKGGSHTPPRRSTSWEEGPGGLE